jgi:hypothetical protein
VGVRVHKQIIFFLSVKIFSILRLSPSHLSACGVMSHRPKISINLAMEVIGSNSLQHPFTCLISGPTQCGKTQLVANILLSSLIFPEPQRIVYCYGEYQPGYNQLKSAIPEIEFVQGIDESLEFDSRICNLLILDDLVQKCQSNKFVEDLFTKGSHHRNLSVILITQNLFQQASQFRTISLNSSYIVVFKNPRDQSQITHLAKQMFPNCVQKVQKAFRDATEQPHGYLLFDLKQDTNDSLRVRSKIADKECSVYVLH